MSKQFMRAAVAITNASPLTDTTHRQYLQRVIARAEQVYYYE